MRHRATCRKTDLDPVVLLHLAFIAVLFWLI